MSKVLNIYQRNLTQACFSVARVADSDGLTISVLTSREGISLNKKTNSLLNFIACSETKWSLIARRLPGRTDNEIKNYWNTHIKRELIVQGLNPQTHRPFNATASTTTANSKFDFRNASHSYSTLTDIDLTMNQNTFKLVAMANDSSFDDGKRMPGKKQSHFNSSFISTKQPHFQSVISIVATSNQDENANFQNHQDLNRSQQQDPQSSEMELKQHGVGPKSQQQQIDTSQELKQPQDDRQQRQLEQNPFHFSQTLGVQSSEKNLVHILEPDRTHNPESESHNPKLQNMNNQEAMTTEQAMNPMNCGKQVPFAMLLPVLQPQLDKDRAMQLHSLYYKLKKNEISKDGFVRHMRAVVGDQMLKMAVYKLQAQVNINRLSKDALMTAIPIRTQLCRYPEKFLIIFSAFNNNNNHLDLNFSGPNQRNSLQTKKILSGLLKKKIDLFTIFSAFNNNNNLNKSTTTIN
ncbi:unnamed protein product [Camellia sinensis]